MRKLALGLCAVLALAFWPWQAQGQSGPEMALRWNSREGSVRAEAAQALRRVEDVLGVRGLSGALYVSGGFKVGPSGTLTGGAAFLLQTRADMLGKGLRLDVGTEVLLTEGKFDKWGLALQLVYSGSGGQSLSFGPSVRAGFVVLWSRRA